MTTKLSYALSGGIIAGVCCGIIGGGMLIDAQLESRARLSVEHDGYSYAVEHFLESDMQCNIAVKMGYGGSYFEDSWAHGCYDYVKEVKHG
jgi:hypothetical protein